MRTTTRAKQYLLKQACALNWQAGAYSTIIPICFLLF
jgi:hypothetical protein